MNFLELQSIIVCAMSSFTNPIHLVNEKKELIFCVIALRLSKHKWSLKWEFTPQANVKYFPFFSSCPENFCGGYSLPILEVLSEHVGKVMVFVNLKNAK